MVPPSQRSQKYLDAGKPTRFRFEGAVRHGIRDLSRIARRAMAGGRRQRRASDKGGILETAHQCDRVGMKGNRNSRALMAAEFIAPTKACQKAYRAQFISSAMYCCEECRMRAKSKRGYHEHAEENVIRARAARVAARAMGEIQSVRMV